MKSYMSPDVEIVYFTTENVADVSIGVGEGEGNDDI